MTEPAPTWPCSEREAQRQIVQALTDAGWLVVDNSQVRQTRGNDPGLPDLYCCRRGRSLWVEVKSLTGKLGESQEAFRQKIWPHLGPHLDYTVARTKWDVEQWL